ncbi:flavodoxin family protein [Thermodesulfobacteriota bacterium]
MIKVIGISGSRVKGGNMDALVQKAVSRLDQYEDATGEMISLADKTINGCIHCNWCVRKQTEGKFCAHEDDMEMVYRAVVGADGIIIGSPAHFGRLSGLTANMIDRLRVFVHGNLYKGGLRNKIGGAMAIAYFRGGGIESTLQSINVHFSAVQMIIATPDGHNRYQIGAGAFTTREGKGRFEKDIRHIVLEDDYGVASAEGLVDRMVDLARIVKAGLAARA